MLLLIDFNEFDQQSIRSSRIKIRKPHIAVGDRPVGGDVPGTKSGFLQNVQASIEIRYLPRDVIDSGAA